MVKVKKNSNSETYSKSKKKSLNVVHSIKSPQSRKKSLATVISPPKKNKNKKSFDSAFKITEINKDETSAIQKKKKHGFVKSVDLGTAQDKNTTQKVLKDKYNINIKDVESAVKGVIKLYSVNPKVKNQLFDDESFPITVLISCHKIPRGHATILRIPLKHSLLTADDEVCLIVSEVKGIGNKEHEKHVDHYEELLSKKGVTNIKKIMTVHELKTEYETFEQKLRLVDLYDAFLVCGKVSGKVVKKCGKIFYKKRKVPTPVKLYCSNLKEHIDKQLSKAFLNLTLKGDCYNVTFGHSKMEISQVVENFASIVDFLDKHFPGGFDNIKGLQISSPRTTSIPVYISTKNPVEIPKVTVKNLHNKFTTKEVKGELTTLPNAEVTVKPSGQVIVKRVKGSDDEDEENNDKITLKDIQDDIKNEKKGNNLNQGLKKKENKKKNTDKIDTKKTKVAEEEILLEQVKSNQVAKKNKESETDQKIPAKLKPKKKLKHSDQEKITGDTISTTSEQVVKKKKRKHSEQMINEVLAKQSNKTKSVKKINDIEEKSTKKKLKRNKNSD